MKKKYIAPTWRNVRMKGRLCIITSSEYATNDPAGSKSNSLFGSDEEDKGEGFFRDLE